LTGPTDQ